MRLKTFHAKSMKDVMAEVRNTLGVDAIIVQIDESSTGVRVTAAIEGNPTPPTPSKPPTPPETPLVNELANKTPTVQEYDKADIAAVVNYHGLPFETAELLKSSASSLGLATLSEAFAVALETVISFSPITNQQTRPIMLVGPPGAGKTVATAKLTADALLHGKTVKIVSTDTVKAGGVAQLDHFAQLMKQTVSTANTPEELSAIVQSEDTTTTIIDTAGTNPFDLQELKTLLNFIQAIDAEPVLVMPAGLDPVDAQEIAGIFARMGCRRFIATRLDAARRYAGLIMAARPGHLSFAGFSRSPFVADAIEPAQALNFARLLTSLPKKHNHANRKEPTL